MLGPCLYAGVRSCGVSGRRGSKRRPGYRGAMPVAAGGRRPSVESCSQRDTQGGRCASAWTRDGPGGAVSFRGAQPVMCGRLG
jgi:hypothetical protein